MSPEIWSNHLYDAKSDMWALGCLLFELAQFECVRASQTRLCIVQFA